jgi:hypothetical protein
VKKQHVLLNNYYVLEFYALLGVRFHESTNYAEDGWPKTHREKREKPTSVGYMT